MISYLLVLLLLTSSAAFACSCPPVKALEIEFARSPEVFRAMRVSSTQETRPGWPRKVWLKETVVFRVTKVWKGPLKEGQLITAISEVGSGSCGYSVINDPVVFEEVDPKTHDTKPARFGGDWVIFSSESSYTLDMCTASQPVDLNPHKLLRQLDDIAAFAAKHSVNKP